MDGRRQADRYSFRACIPMKLRRSVTRFDRADWILSKIGVQVLERRIPYLIFAGLLAGVCCAQQGTAQVADARQQAPATAAGASSSWGTFLKPFAPDSLWNSRPVAPVLGDFVIPKSNYYPRIGEGKYSLGVFLAKPTDDPVTVNGISSRKGVWDPDSEVRHESISIPRWPPEATPAEGSDGHADIVDPVSGIVHSFHVLRRENGRWLAAQYAWTRIDGRGWGDPAHYMQGARAAGVPSMAGLIRKHEVRNGDTLYRHALAVSLTFNALSAQPAYVFPATSADTTANRNYGVIPEGTLLMLPESFDVQRIANPDLRKVAETLKVYGAYVVDRNVGTPFHIYVENGSGFNLHGARWNSVVAAQLDRIRASLRPVISAAGWIDGNGRPYAPEKNLNLLSMRGPWRLQAGATLGIYDTWTQAVRFTEISTRTVQVNSSSRSMQAVSWANPTSGTTYRLTAVATGGARLRFQLRDRSSRQIVMDSKELGDGEMTTFVWPEHPVAPIVWAISGAGPASTVRGTLTADAP
jgi:hypothetical protein